MLGSAHSVTEPRTSRLQHSLLALAVAAIALAQALRVTADPDLWWQLRTGQLILEQRALPTTDPFSFTAAGAPWTNHEWLTDAIFALAFRWGGGAGLSVLRIGLLAGVAALLGWLLYRRARLPLVAAAMLAAYFPFFAGLLNVRAHSFTYLLALLVLAILEVGSTRPRVLFLLPAIIALWANLHGGFLLGLAIATLGLTAQFTGLEHPPRAAAARPRRAFWLLLGASLVAPLLNPRGIELASYLWRELGADHATVSEWKSLTQLPGLWPAFLALVLPPLALLLLAPARARLTETALFLASVFLAYRHARFIALLAIFASLVLATGLGGLWLRRRALRSADPWIATTPALAVLAGLLALWALPRVAADFGRKGMALEVDPRLAPVLAVRFLADHELGPHLATRLDWGGYALYHLWPRYRVSIDGRNLTVYAESFVARQIAAYDEAEPLRGLRDFRVDAALVESAGPGFEGMRREPGWEMVFRDPLSAVFVPRARAVELARSAPREKSYGFTETVLTFP